MKITIEKIFDTFISANERSWYPWTWPEKEWFLKTDKKEVNKFLNRVRELATEDFFFFCDEIARNPEHPHLELGLHDELCHVMQSGYDAVILMPRGHLKTTLSSVDYPLWLLGKNPNLKIMLASETVDVSEKFLSEIKQNILYNERLKAVFPNLKPLRARGHAQYVTWNAGEILIERNIIAKEPSIKVMGALQTFTGLHFDHHGYDDIMTDSNAANEDRIKKINDWYDMSLNLLNPGGRKIIDGTRYRDNDLYGRLEEKRDMPFYVRKAIEDDEYIWNRPKVIKHVQEMKKQLSSYMFHCQYLNDPIDEENQEIRADWIKKWDVDEVRWMVESPPDDDVELLEKWYKTLAIYMGSDPNRTVKKRSDNTAIMVVGVDKDKRKFVLYYLRKKMQSPKIIQKYCDIFCKWDPIVAKIETVGGDEHLLPLIKEELKKRERTDTYKVKAFFTPKSISKEDRIKQTIPEFEARNVWIKYDMVDLETEIVRFPYAKYDDLFETLAYILKQCVKEIKEPKPKDTYRGWRTKHRYNGSWLTA